MIVVDTNLIGYLFLHGERSEQAEEVLRRDPHWAAPLLWRSELRNVLALQMRIGRLSMNDAQAIMSQAEQLLNGSEYTASSHEVLRLAAASGCTAYDCELVALAQDLNAPLVTVDRQVLAAFPNLARSPEQFVA